MPRTMVLGDLHGNYKALLQCFERSGFNYDEDTLIQLGDVVDGWPDVWECVEELLKIKNLIAIKGNHDDWFWDFIDGTGHGSRWSQGADATLKSYLTKAGKQDYLTMIKYGDSHYFQPEDISRLHRKFFEEQLPFYKLGEKLFIHGGFNRHYPLEQTPQYLYYWDRDLWSQALSWQAMGEEDRINNPFKMKDKFEEIFIGHTSVNFWGTDKPMHCANIWNLDTGAGWAGKLTIMDVDTKEIWQSDNARELYPYELGRNKK